MDELQGPGPSSYYCLLCPGRSTREVDTKLAPLLVPLYTIHSPWKPRRNPVSISHHTHIPVPPNDTYKYTSQAGARLTPSKTCLSSAIFVSPLVRYPSTHSHWSSGATIFVTLRGSWRLFQPCWPVEHSLVHISKYRYIEKSHHLYLASVLKNLSPLISNRRYRH
ncbi:hypothetical protein BD779DRAFT_986484 [Infundibulicybe gibba]|nr:hypothetical protein BD779DRAFT_986484 [Infundibulicybe gibba]